MTTRFKQSRHLYFKFGSVQFTEILCSVTLYCIPLIQSTTPVIFMLHLSVLKTFRKSEIQVKMIILHMSTVVGTKPLCNAKHSNKSQCANRSGCRARPTDLLKCIKKGVGLYAVLCFSDWLYVVVFFFFSFQRGKLICICWYCPWLVTIAWCLY